MQWSGYVDDSKWTKKKGGVNMSDLINYADYDRIADIFGFDDPEDPLWAKSRPATENDEDDSER